jgi:predicted DNA-binding transcriptional regulator YafY
MTLSVAGTLEITPWIRGWGPDVEVLEPEALRGEFERWAKQLHEIYGG